MSSMPLVGRVGVQVAPLFTGVQRAIAGEYGKAVAKVGPPIGEKFGNAINTGTKVVAGSIAATLGVAISKGFSRFTAMEDATAKLEGLGYTAKEVATIMEDVVAALDGTAYLYADGASVAAGALAAGVKEGKELEAYLRLVGDAAAQAGVDYNHMGQIMNKVTGDGRLMGDTIQQMAQNGVYVLPMLSKEFGVTQEEMRKMVSNGEIDAKTFQRVLEDNMGGSAERMGEKTRGAMMNAGAAVGAFGEKIWNEIGPKFTAALIATKDKLYELQPAATQIGKVLADVADWVADNINWLSKLAIAIGGASVAYQGMRLAARAVAIPVDGIRAGYEAIKTMTTGIHGFILAARGTDQALLMLRNLGPAGEAGAAAFSALVSPIGVAKRAMEGFQLAQAGVTTGLTHGGAAMKAGVALHKLYAGAVALSSKALGNFTVATRALEGFRLAQAGVTTGLTHGGKAMRAGVALHNTYAGAVGLSSKALAGFRTATVRAQGGLVALGGIMKAHPLAAIASVVAAAAAGLTFFFTQTEKGREIFESLKQAMQPLVDKIMPTLVKVGDAVSATFASLMDVLGPIVDDISEKFSSLTEGLGPALGGIGDKFSAMFNELAPVVMDLGERLGEAFKPVAEVFMESLVPAFMEFWAVVQSIVPTLLEALAPVLPTLGEAFASLGETVGSFAASLGELIPIVLTALLPVIGLIGATVVTLLEVLTPVIATITELVVIGITMIIETIVPLVEMILEILIPVITQILEVVTVVFEALAPVIEAALNIVVEIIQTITALIAGDWEAVWEGIKGIALAVWDTIVAVVQGALEIVWAVISGVLSAIQEIWTAIWGAIKTVVSVIWNGIKATITAVFTGIMDTISSVLSSIRSIWDTAWGGIKNSVSNIWENGIKPIFTTLGNFIRDHVAPPFERGIQAIKKAWDKLKKIAASPVRFMVNTVLNKGLIKAFNTLTSWIPGVKELNEIKLPKGFATGGYTGDGHWLQPAGIVHAGEFVLTKKTTSRIARKHGLAALEEINRTGELPGYASGSLVKPVRGGTITSRFGASRGRYPHAGIDFAVPTGTPVYAAMAGQVLNAAWNAITGRTGKGIFLGHDGNRNTYYGHLSRLLVKVGDVVTKGQKIAESGNTGNSTGPHLHFETWSGGKPVNPEPYLAGAILPPSDGKSGASVNPLGALLDFGKNFVKKFTDKFPKGGIYVDAATGTVKKIYEDVKTWAQDKIASIGDVITAGGDKINAGTAKAQVKAAAVPYGWAVGKQWKALSNIIQKESGWDPKAANPSSSARGLFQKMTSIHGPVETTAAGQAGWGLSYIKKKYGDPIAAWAFHQRNNWYDTGGLVTPASSLIAGAAHAKIRGEDRASVPVPDHWLFRDRGGNLPPGLSMVMNKTGRDETILPIAPKDLDERLRTGNRGGITIQGDVHTSSVEEFAKHIEERRRQAEALSLM